MFVYKMVNRQKMVNMYKCSIFAIMEIQFAIQTQAKYQPNCKYRLHVDATIIESCRESYFHVSGSVGQAQATHDARWQYGDGVEFIIFRV